MNHSKKYDMVKRFYDNGLWTKYMVYNAVGKYITAAEYTEIIGEEYE